MKLTVLVENTASDPVLAPEFGLSMHIETTEGALLFDMGASARFLANASQLKVDLRNVDTAVLSHGHYDHGGGLGAFLRHNHNAIVYMHRDAAGHHFAVHASKTESTAVRPSTPLLSASRPALRFIGIDTHLAGHHAHRICPLNADRKIGQNQWLLTDIDRVHPRPTGNRSLLTRSNGALVCDPFDHEVVLVIREPDGMVVITGCGHTGILNIIQTVRRRVGAHEPIKAVIGGFHLTDPTDASATATAQIEVEQIAQALNQQVQGIIYTGHCTGHHAYHTLDAVLGKRLQRIETGTIHTI